jgi:hypothetical protein
MANRLLTAFVVLAALLAVTVWQFNARDTDDTRAPEVSVKLPKLKKDDIDELSIAVPEKPALVVKKTDKTWNLTAPLAAAADNASVEAALAKLEELEVIGVAATKPENYAQLEVDDKKAVHIVAKQGGKVLADLLVGTYRGGNTMVREQSAVNVATVKGSIKYAFDKDVKDWRDRLIFETSSDQVKTISFDNPKGSFHFVHEGKEWKQAPLAKGEKPLPNFDGGKVIALVGTATGLRANDFAAPDMTADAAGVGDKPDGLVTLTTGGDAGEQQIVLRVGHKRDDGYYLAREGKTPIYVVSDFSGGRLIPGADQFAKDKDAKAGGAPPPGGAQPGGMNPGMAELLRQHPELAGQIQPH